MAASTSPPFSHPCLLPLMLYRISLSQEAVFFEVEVTEQDLQEGFYIFANSTTGSKFKLLHFDKKDSGGLQLNLQVLPPPLLRYTSAPPLLSPLF